MAQEPASHWHSLAACWAHVGEPLRPGAQDVSFVCEMARAWRAVHACGPDALILGVTPELHRALAPLCASVRAADHTAEMIERVWPGARADAVLADWQALPLADGTIDLVCCDGGLHLLDLPGQRALFIEAGRVLRPGGLLVMRLFERPSPCEDVGAVLGALAQGHVASVHELKVRLAMALQRERAVGVRLHDVWEALHPHGHTLRLGLGTPGWTSDALDTLRAYEGSQRRYRFSSAAEALHEAGVAGLTSCAQRTPDYPMGERFPSITWRRANG